MASIGFILALLMNIFIYGYFQIKIIQQQTRNSFLQTNIDITNAQLRPINEFNEILRRVNQQVDLVNEVEVQRDDTVAFLQHLSKVTPDHIYFTLVLLSGQNVGFNGIAASPLYIADFLDRLRDPKGIFRTPVLRSNTTNDGNNYNFDITTTVESSIKAELNNGSN